MEEKKRANLQEAKSRLHQIQSTELPNLVDVELPRLRMELEATDETREERVRMKKGRKEGRACGYGGLR